MRQYPITVKVKNRPSVPRLVWSHVCLTPLDPSSSASVHSAAVPGLCWLRVLWGVALSCGLGVLRRWSWALGVTLWAAGMENVLWLRVESKLLQPRKPGPGAVPGWKATGLEKSRRRHSAPVQPGPPKTGSPAAPGRTALPPPSEHLD